MLIGPDPGGAKALVPPGTFVRCPDTTRVSYARRGWREAHWTHAALEERFLESCPRSVRQVSFLYFALAVQISASSHREWLERRARQHLGSLDVLIGRAELEADELLELQHERDELLLDASKVFGGDWVRCEQDVSGMAPGR